MGKRNSREGNRSRSAAKPNSEALPSFDEKALSALTAKIEEDFEKAQLRQGTQAEQSTGNRKPGKGSKSSTPHNQKSNTAVSELVRGTKRDANGNAQKAGKGVASSKKDSRLEKNTDEKDDRAVLLREILALGGTEEDLDLVADALSDEEDEPSTTRPDNRFRQDLAKFVAGLGIEGQIGEDENEDENTGNEKLGKEIDDGGDVGWEEASDSGSSVDASDVEAEPESRSRLLDSVPLATSVSNASNHLIFEPRPDWHAAALDPLPTSEGIDQSKYNDTITNLKSYASSLLEADANLYASRHLSSSSSHRFLSTIMSSGTLSDKVSALTLVVQESPVHTTKSFDSLLTLANKRSRGQAVTALGALKDLLGVGVVLPADRRLKSFGSQPGLLGTLHENSVSVWRSGQKLPGHISKAHLISWAYEDWLKESYFDMLKVLEGWCNDEVEYARSRAVTYVYELLKEKPEQEANLLRLLVNKLGDPDKKIASRTSYLLLQLQNSHPLMKPVIIRSIQSELLLRPGQSSHAKYYAINTLNQTILSGREEEVAKKLLSIYFDLFVALLKKPDPAKESTVVVNKKGQVQGGGAPMGKKAKAKATKEAAAKLASEETTEKMISAVLTGVNRAFPFSKTDEHTLGKHMDTLFRITHSSNFNTSIQALMLIEQVATSKHIEVDRFYRTLYESLLDPRLVNSSKHALYLNLLFRALRSDLSVKRVKAFAKRMLQIVTLHQPPFICGVFYLLRELEARFPALKTLLNDPEEGDEGDEEVFVDAPEPGAEMVPDTHVPFSASNGKTSYDGRKRDPEHSNADKSCLWESIPFLVHFHPSVSLFASRLLNEKKMPPKPDLASHTLASFLDRFVYRNAKAAAGGSRGGSIMQPLPSTENKSILLSNRTNSHTQGPVNTEAFWRKKIEDVAVDEVFFHKYFSQTGRLKKVPEKARRAAGDEEDEEDENEDEIWQALVDSRPEVEGDGEDSDMEMLDLDELDAGSSTRDSEIDQADGELDFEGPETDTSSEPGEDLSDSDSEIGTEIDELFAKELQTTQPVEEDEESSRAKRRRLKGLPTFASVDEYAEMLDNDDDEDL